MAKQQSIVSLDPIDRKKEKGFIGRLLVTRWYKGKPVVKMEPYGHYMFCGPQGASKSVSVLWYAEQLHKRYKRKRIHWYDESSESFKRFTEPPGGVVLYSNFGIGKKIDKKRVFETIDEFDPMANEVRVVIIDEIHTYFPREGGNDKETVKIRNDLLAVFSQLRKRNTYILSTAQVYGRLHKALREQCLYMVNCKVNINNKLVNDFIPGDDVIADDYGRWAGDPKFIKVHGLPKTSYNTKRLIRE